MSLLSIFGKFGHTFAKPSTADTVETVSMVAGAAVSAFNPGLGALIEMIGRAVYSVEMAAAGSAGAAKKDQVKDLIDVSAPLTMNVLQQVAGKPIENPDQLAPTLDALIDDTVALFNALGVFEHAAKEVAPVATAAAHS